MSHGMGLRIKQAREAAGMTQEELGEATEISQNQISRYESDQVDIPAYRLGSIALVLRVPIGTLDTRLAGMPSGTAAAPPVRGTRTGDLGVPIPMLGFARAADFESSLQSVEDFAIEASDGATVVFPQSRQGDMALTVEGDSMLPWYPPGTVLLVRPGEFAQRGDIVVAKLGTGAVVVKRYQRRQNVVTLESLNHGSEGETFEWHVKEQPGFILWMWPVIQSTRDERSVRWHATKMGAV